MAIGQEKANKLLVLGQDKAYELLVLYHDKVDKERQHELS